MARVSWVYRGFWLSCAFTACLALSALVTLMDGNQKRLPLSVWFVLTWVDLALAVATGITTVLYAGSGYDGVRGHSTVGPATARRVVGAVRIFVGAVAPLFVIVYWYRFDGEEPGTVSTEFRDSTKRMAWVASMQVYVGYFPWTLACVGISYWASARETVGPRRDD